MTPRTMQMKLGLDIVGYNQIICLSSRAFGPFLLLKLHDYKMNQELVSSQKKHCCYLSLSRGIHSSQSFHAVWIKSVWNDIYFFFLSIFFHLFCIHYEKLPMRICLAFFIPYLLPPSTRKTDTWNLRKSFKW